MMEDYLQLGHQVLFWEARNFKVLCFSEMWRVLFSMNRRVFHRSFDVPIVALPLFSFYASFPPHFLPCYRVSDHASQ
uniref:Uncharacterized protein n=1 Tax=Parascaris univalens TaxID=6257 RepID=A0A914ZVJ1_PARUN